MCARFIFCAGCIFNSESKSLGGGEKRDSEEVCLHNYVTLGGGRPRNEETVAGAPIPSQVIWAGSPKMMVGRRSMSIVHDMRKVWSPSDQSCILGEPTSKMVGRGELAQLFYWRVIGHRGSTVSSCPGHGLPAHHFGSPAQITWLEIGAPHIPHSMDGLPKKSRNCGGILLRSYHTLGTAGRRQQAPRPRV